ncbi:hypothetical protein [Bradyrhizobium paxllaeri]|uniref:hypothetical protein n=1 Tax=Bradyrhizobium paxllaeri TaxID=190148 RepID=UPI001FEA25AD|nr:hypothetical protein [Bradyrhizobium paxllaeri]
MIPVTHDYLSFALGLRRAGVTETLIRFEEQRLIRKMRGVLQIHGIPPPKAALFDERDRCRS